MKKINVIALIKLAEHLKNYKLTSEYEKILLEQKKVTSGVQNNECFVFVVSEMPKLFSSWENWSEYGLIIYKPSAVKTFDDVEVAFKLFFQINSSIYRHLFVPGQQNTRKFKSKILTIDATPEDVAKNIYLLIDWAIKFNR